MILGQVYHPANDLNYAYVLVAEHDEVTEFLQLWSDSPRAPQPGDVWRISTQNFQWVIDRGSVIEWDHAAHPSPIL